MKKLQFILVILILLALFNSCGKAHYNPIEHYTLQGTNEEWVFSKSDFGVDLHRPYNTPYWYRCDKIGDFEKGFIIIDKINYEYQINKNLVELFKYNPYLYDTLKPVYTLILDKSKRNVPGIFQSN